MHTSIVCIFNMACRVLIARICMALNSLSPRIKKIHLVLFKQTMSVFIQYTYIVGKYIIYLYELYKQVEKSAFW